MGSRAVLAFVIALGAAGVAGCGGGAAEPPPVVQPAPDCNPPPVTPVVEAASTVAGPPSDPGTCRQPIAASALPAARVRHLGTLAVNASVAFDVPAGTGSFTVVEQAVAASAADVQFVGSPLLRNVAVPLRLTDPAGRVFYDDAAAVPLDFSLATAVSFGGRPGTGVFTVPNTSRTLGAWAGGVPAGTWQLVVGDYAAECANVGASCNAGADLAGRYDVSVLLRPGPVPSTGTVDLSFYLVSSRFQAATAAADAGLARMVSTLGGILAHAGLCLGKVTYLDVPTWAVARYATGLDATATGPCADLSQLFTLSRPDTALPFFLVDDIRQGGLSGLRTVGVDGAIPGPSSFGGTVVSGAAVNASDVGLGTCGGAPDYARCGSDATAAVVAHEAGHWLGLYHVTEKAGTLFDPLGDTGTCRCSACAPTVNQPSCGIAGAAAADVTTADCTRGGSCSGGDNLMFWLLGGDLLSPQQGQVMRANPAVR